MSHASKYTPILHKTFDRDKMSYLSRRELEDLRPDLLRIVMRVMGKPESSVLSAIEHCLYNNYERRRVVEKLSGLVDSNKATRLSEKLEDLLNDHKASQKSRKRAIDDGDCTGEPKKARSNRFDVPPTPCAPVSIPTADPPNPDSIPEGARSGLTSEHIKSMMDNAQRQIELRKSALGQVRGEPQEKGTAVSTTMTEAERELKLAQIRARISGTLANILPQAVIVDKPKPLILDAEGRTVDKSGSLINLPTLEPTLKANIRALKREGFNKAAVPGQSSKKANDEPPQQTFFDDRIAAKVPLRNRRALRFHEPGKFMQMAERMRMKAQLEKLQNEISQIARKTGISSATKLALIAPKTDSKTDEVPEMEWWDSVILSNDLVTMEGDRIAIRDVAITNLIEHPTQMKPPNEPLKPAYAPVFLTKKETKKLRRQNRREAWKEEQEKIRLGLSNAPEPKLRISNLMRVLGTEAVQDPTKMEAHVRDQMAKRQREHEEANAARKLTTEQKRDKKVRKTKEDVTLGVHVAVYRIRDLHDNQSKKFKVETNAKQLLMTGALVLFRDCCVVVVEGGPKQQKRYKRLILNRIRWDEDTVKNADGNEVPNACHLVWEGMTQRRNFGEIKVKAFPMEKMAREFFQKHQVEHYWDLAFSGAVLEAAEDT